MKHQNYILLLTKYVPNPNTGISLPSFNLTLGTTTIFPRLLCSVAVEKLLEQTLPKLRGTDQDSLLPAELVREMCLILDDVNAEHPNVEAFTVSAETPV